MFDVMPMWTDMMGAALVLITVIVITFEKQITGARLSFCCPSSSKDEQDKRDKEKEDIVQQQIDNKASKSSTDDEKA